MIKSMVKINKTAFFSVFLLLATGFVFAQQNTTQQKVDALQLYYNGQYAQAISICQQELVANPNNLDSYVVMCWALVKNRLLYTRNADCHICTSSLRAYQISSNYFFLSNIP